jgi:hypothetical protein
MACVVTYGAAVLAPTAPRGVIELSEPADFSEEPQDVVCSVANPLGHMTPNTLDLSEPVYATALIRENIVALGHKGEHTPHS